MLRQLVERGPTRGVVVGMLEADGTRRVVAWGDPGEGALPLGPESVFEIGSITKVFTGILLADMVRRGEVELSDPVAEHLPPDVRVPTRGGREITLLDLTTHHAALPMMPPDLAPADPLDPFRDYTVERLYRTVSGYALEREPGSGFLYSNVGVALLGRALAYRAGTTWEALVRERILEPLGMSRTAVTPTPWMRNHAVRGHAAGGGPSTPSYPGRRDLLTGGRVGLGWFTSRPGERTIHWTAGLTGGHSTFLGLDPGTGRAVVVLTNTGLTSIDHLGFHLLDPTVPLEAGP